MLAFGALLFGVSLASQVALSRLLPGVGWTIPIVMAFTALGMALTMPNVSALISRSVHPDRQGAMLGLNMAAGSGARILGPILAGVLYSGIGHDWPFLVGALFGIPAAIMALNAGRAFRREQSRLAATQSSTLLAFGASLAYQRRLPSRRALDMPGRLLISKEDGRKSAMKCLGTS